MLDRLGAEVTDLGILKDDPGALAARDRRRRARPRSGADLGRRLDRRSRSCARAPWRRSARLVFWRVAIKPGRPVAMGVIRGAGAGRGAAFVGLPGNPVAAFVTFARVVRPLLLRLAGALPEPLTALPVRLAFAYKKKNRPARIRARRVARRRRRRRSRRSSIRRRAPASSPRSPKPTGSPSSPKTRRRSSRARPSDFSRTRR